MKETIKQILKMLQSYFGKSIFTDPTRFRSALADIPIETDGKIIIYCLEVAICRMQAYSRLEWALRGNNRSAIDNLVAEMSSDSYISKEMAQVVIGCIAELFEYTPNVVSEQPKVPFERGLEYGNKVDSKENLTLFCSKCGNKVTSDSSFCNKCGNALQGTNQANNILPSALKLWLPFWQKFAKGKKSVIVIVVLLVVAVFTNPSEVKHQKAVAVRIFKVLERDNPSKSTGGFDSFLGAVGSMALLEMSKMMIKSQNFVLFSLTKTIIGDYIGIGAFGYVLLFFNDNMLSDFLNGNMSMGQSKKGEDKIEPPIKLPRGARNSAKNIKMVFVKGGTFTMGCTSEQGNDCYNNEKPTHNVTLDNYYIGKYEVTQRQWKQIMGYLPAELANASYIVGDDLPVVSVSWYEIQNFISELNRQTGKKYRLPTEAEWEYAARGGHKSKGYKYSGSDNIDDVTWYTNNSGGKTHEVGTKLSNELGIYDMSGNVWEWIGDWYGKYTSETQTNPMGSSSGLSHVIRGGSWVNGMVSCRVSNRGNNPSDRGNGLGFRLVLPKTSWTENDFIKWLTKIIFRGKSDKNKITTTDSSTESNINNTYFGKYPQASERLLTVSDVQNLSKYDLRIMRNEIFARHGYIFESEDLKNYFQSQSWYTPRYSDVNSFLTNIEKENIAFIRRYE